MEKFFRLQILMWTCCVTLLWSSYIGAQTQEGSVNQKSKTDEAWKELAGKWKCEAAWMEGQAMPKQFSQKMELQMSPGKFVAQTMVGQQKGQLEFVGDVQKRMLKITTILPGTGAKAKLKKQVLNCRYKFENDMLVLVYSQGEKFPEEFKSDKENKYLLVHYKKIAVKKTDSKKKKN